MFPVDETCHEVMSKINKLYLDWPCRSIKPCYNLSRNFLETNWSHLIADQAMLGLITSSICSRIENCIECTYMSCQCNDPDISYIKVFLEWEYINIQASKMFGYIYTKEKWMEYSDCGCECWPSSCHLIGHILFDRGQLFTFNYYTSS